MSPQGVAGCLAAICLLQMSFLPFSTGQADDLGILEALHIAREAYIYYSPVIVNWNILFLTTSPEVSPDPVQFNTFRNGDAPRIPNDNVLYSLAWLDLRAQAQVITVPPITDRYYSVHIIDAYTHNIGIVSDRLFPQTGQDRKFVVRRSGQSVGCFFGNDGVFDSESFFVLVLVRIQVNELSNDDLALIQVIQSGFNIEGLLSQVCGIPIPPIPPPVIIPLPQNASLTLQFIRFINLISITLEPRHPTEMDLLERFERIGLVPGQSFDPDALDPVLAGAIEFGLRLGNSRITREARNPDDRTDSEGWQVLVDPPFFGNRSALLGPDELGDEERAVRILRRAVAARVGLYGLDPEEAFYPSTRVSANGFPLSAARDRTLWIHITADTNPPVQAYWSITMYDRFNNSFVPNPINRFSLGSREEDSFCRYNDYSYPIIIQRDQPDEPRFQPNWLPAPDGPFFLIARLYRPEQIALDGPYLPPGVRYGIPQVPDFCPP